MAGSCGGVSHVDSVLPIRVLEAASGKPLRIAGVAMVAGISRNFNVYTPNELAAFAEKLKAAPVYIEHVSASRAVGKVTETAFDPVLRAITYVAEIYDEAIAEKIRNGLIQHVSVGADYQVMDVVDAKVPRGLYNAELSLVAVPGVPETTIHVLEHLAAASKNSSKIKLQTKELLQDLHCVFCGGPGEYLVSVCTNCGDNAQSHINLNGVEKLEEKDFDKLADLTAAKINEKTSQENKALKAKLAEADQASADRQAQVERSQKYGIGIKAKNSSVTKPSEYADVPDDQFGDPVNFRYPLDKGHVQAALSYFNQPDNRSDYSAEEQAKIMAKIVSAALAAGVEVTYQPNDSVYKALPEELKAKCKGYAKEQSSEERLAAVLQKVKDQDKLLEMYRKVAPGVELLAEPPVLMPVQEAVKVIKEVLPSSMVQHSWGLGPQRMCQELNRAIQKLERRGK
jgi:hypothetical protein